MTPYWCRRFWDTQHKDKSTSDEMHEPHSLSQSHLSVNDTSANSATTPLKSSLRYLETPSPSMRDRNGGFTTQQMPKRLGQSRTPETNSDNSSAMTGKGRLHLHEIYCRIIKIPCRYSLTIFAYFDQSLPRLCRCDLVDYRQSQFASFFQTKVSISVAFPASALVLFGPFCVHLQGRALSGGIAAIATPECV